MEWTHKPTALGGPETYQTDRTVFYDEKMAGRVRLLEHGPSRGLWQWSGSWPGPAHYGRCDSLEEALEAVREGLLRNWEKRCYK